MASGFRETLDQRIFYFFLVSFSFLISFYLEGDFDSGELRSDTGGSREKEASFA